jgi:hypothetical protein
MASVKAKPKLTAARLRELLKYDQFDGRWVWVRSRRGVCLGGTEAGSIDASTGYRRIAVDGRRDYSSHLAILYVEGHMPRGVDHINLVRHDDSLLNLRRATCSQQGANTRLRTNNTSGFRGVSWDNRRRKWRAQICVKGRRRSLGFFDTAADTHLAWWQAAREVWGEFVRVA